ncbi:Os04g0504901, partial [Oryza sativa Japonica Group]
MSLQTRTDITCPAWLKSSYSCESVTDASRSPTYSDCAPPPPRPTATPTPPAAAAAVTAPGEPPFTATAAICAAIAHRSLDLAPSPFSLFQFFSAK